MTARAKPYTHVGTNYYEENKWRKFSVWSHYYFKVVMCGSAFMFLFYCRACSSKRKRGGRNALPCVLCCSALLQQEEWRPPLCLLHTFSALHSSVRNHATWFSMFFIKVREHLLFFFHATVLGLLFCFCSTRIEPTISPLRVHRLSLKSYIILFFFIFIFFHVVLNLLFIFSLTSNHWRKKS
jgi:hypothetical protein